MANAASVYCAQVNKHLTCPYSMKKPFLRQLREEIVFYCDEHGEMDQKSLYVQFGTPETVAEEFLSELSPQTVTKCANRRRKILFAAWMVLVLAVVAVGILGIQSSKMQQKLHEEEFVASITYEDDADRRWFWPSFQDIIFGHAKVID